MDLSTGVIHNAVVNKPARNGDGKLEGNTFSVGLGESQLLVPISEADYTKDGEYCILIEEYKNTIGSSLFGIGSSAETKAKSVKKFDSTSLLEICTSAMYNTKEFMNVGGGYINIPFTMGGSGTPKYTTTGVNSFGNPSTTKFFRIDIDRKT